MAVVFRRLAKSAPLAFGNAFREQPKSNFRNRFPLGAIAAISGGITYFYNFSAPETVIPGSNLTWVSSRNVFVVADEMGRFGPAIAFVVMGYMRAFLVLKFVNLDMKFKC